MFFSINTFFFYPTLASILLMTLAIIFRKKFRNKRVWHAVMIFAGVCLFFIGSSFIEDFYYQWKVDGFKGVDGTYNYNTITAEERRYEDLLISDTGRNLSIIVGPILGLIVSVLYLSVASFADFLIKKYNLD